MTIFGKIAERSCDCLAILAAHLRAMSLYTAAIGFYEHAIACGLQGEELRCAYVSLGSTYCSVGRFGDAARILQRGAAVFPDAPEFDVFLALTRYHLGEHQEAMRLLLGHIAEYTAEPATQGHKRAIAFCADHLDQAEDN